MERHYEDHIVCYPKNEEVHYSELSEKAMDELDIAPPFSWSSGDARLRQTTVFIERFFYKTPCKELAERFGVKENTIVCMYARAVESIEKIIAAIDARREGMKATKSDRFTEDQKYFLLVSIFGFSGAEVARIFKKDRNRVNMKVKHMADKYEDLFKAPVKKSVYDGLSKDQMKDRILGR